MAKRAKGPPRDGKAVSVVVTDIEGYSSLMGAAPDLMAVALGMHNQAVRRAAFANAGAVLEQEGDSYTVVFYEPFDAVAFCLQVGGGGRARSWGVRVVLRCLGAPCHMPGQLMGFLGAGGRRDGRRRGGSCDTMSPFQACTPW